MARVQDGRVLFDLRTVFERQEDGLVEAIRSAATRGAERSEGFPSLLRL